MNAFVRRNGLYFNEVVAQLAIRASGMRAVALQSILNL
jgi:hypothetical protein